jgi:hypothetical protein
VLSLFTDHLKQFADIRQREGVVTRNMCGGLNCEGLRLMYSDFIDRYLPQNCPIIDANSAYTVTTHLDRWLKWKGFVRDS